MFLALILYLNFLQRPKFYDADMYSDMCFSQQVWEQKSIFPDGWVFGNQLYVIATPILASVFFGITKNLTLSMAIASSLMSLFILLSFVWMIKPLCKKKSSILAGTAMLLLFPLAQMKPVVSCAGWQLLYTMCSYYACYLITAFLSFGCYFRFQSQKASVTTKIAFVIAMLLSLGCGIQSLRQTVVMILPLLALEFLSMIIRIKNKKKLFQPETFAVILLSFANVIGLAVARLVSVPKHEIFNKIEIKSFSGILKSIFPSLKTIVLLLDRTWIWVVVIGTISATLMFILIVRDKKNLDLEVKYFLLFGFGIALIFAISILTTMKVRDIYYFMIYPFVAILFIFIFESSSSTIRYILTPTLLVVSIIYCGFGVNSIRAICNPHAFEATCEYLAEQNIDTIYTGFGFGQKIAVASDFEIKAGFWIDSKNVFKKVDYICNPDVFDADPKHSAYLFNKKKEIATAEEKAKELGLEFTFVKYIPEDKTWIYTSPSNLMNQEQINALP